MALVRFEPATYGIVPSILCCYATEAVGRSAVSGSQVAQYGSATLC